MVRNWAIHYDLYSLNEEQRENLALELVSRGGEGTYFEGATTLCCYFEAETASDVELWVASLGLEHNITYWIEELEAVNWTQKCQELLVPLKVGDITVLPVASSDDGPIDASNIIKIIPGLGFGTGHHETTSFCLKFLQSDLISLDTQSRVLDVGTGSGILAIAAAKRFHCHVDAFDIDDGAVENAIENVALNCVQRLVNVEVSNISRYESSYDLVIANIYAEILLELKEALIKAVKPGGQLLLSGILESRYNTIKRDFSPGSWEYLGEYVERGWVTTLLKAV